LNVNRLSDEHVSIFRVKEQAKETSLKAGGKHNHLSSRWSLWLGFFSDIENGDMFPEISPRFYGLHGVISQKIELAIPTVDRTSNPTKYKLPNSIKRFLLNREKETDRHYKSKFMKLSDPKCIQNLSPKI
jgi:hypothetical protein